jgi:gluconolactonase
MSYRTLFVPSLCTVFALIATSAIGQQPQEPIPGIGPTGPVVQVKTDYMFTEGPASDAAGNLFFVDIPNNRIHKMDAEGNVTALTEMSKMANGLMFRAPNELFACEM